MERLDLTFRIFVSSTFSDLKAERNALQESAFPKLRAYCQERGARFQAIDLRWGVSEEAALDQQTMNICLQELKRCQIVSPRPNFIILLGERYGWRPLPPQIEASEFEMLLERVPPDQRPLLLEWYKRDDNAVPPEYCLQPRKVDIGDTQTDQKEQAAHDAEARRWSEQTEPLLHSLLINAARAVFLDSEDPRRQKYEDSATHQEIRYGAFKAEDPQSHVFAYFRTIEGLPEDDRAKDYLDIKNGTIESETQDRLRSLKEELGGGDEEHRGLLPPEHIYKYTSQWRDGQPQSDLKALCDRVESDLREIIDSELAAFQQATELEREIEAHQEFGQQRAVHFVGRQEILGKIQTYIAVKSNHPLVVHGLSGSGKTALMARAIQVTKEAFPDAVAIFRFIGATPSSSDGRSLLESLCHQIYQTFNFEEQRRNLLAQAEHPYRQYIKKVNEPFAQLDAALGHHMKEEPSVPLEWPKRGPPTLGSLMKISAIKEQRQIEEDYSIPLEFQKLSTTFRDFLTKIPTGRKFLLFMDALDQLSDTDHARSLSWLPDNLPENVRLIVSCLPSNCLSILQRRLPQQNIVELKPMPVEEGEKLLDIWLNEADRTLQARQRSEVLGEFQQCRLPLYLKLAFEESRLWKSYTERVKLSPDVPGIIRDLLGRLSLDANHGQMVVSRSLGYLAAARNGLTEDELLDVLSLDKEVISDFLHRSPKSPAVERLPVVVWSRLYFDLKPYLTERTADGTSLMAFYHPQFGRVVVEEFLAGEVKKKRHQGLALYFAEQSLWIGRDKKRNPNLRKVSELPYQQTYGELWDEIEKILCDLHFIEAKCAAGMTYDLINDYNMALDFLPEAQPEKQERLKHEARVKKYTEDLIAYARGEIDHLDIIPSVEPWSEEGIRQDTERIINNPTRLDRLRAFSQFVKSESRALNKFASHPGFVMQQAYNSARFGPVAGAAESIVHREIDNVLLLRFPSHCPGYHPHPTLLMTLEGSASSVSLAPDGRRAISGSRDSTVRLWDLESGQCLRTLEGHTDQVTSVSVTPDGERAVSGGPDMVLRVWDLDSGECLRSLKGHTDSIISVSLTPDGRRTVSGSSDYALRFWDLESGECLRILEGHTGDVNSVSVTPDGKRAVSGSGDMTVRLWDLESGQCLRTLEGHTGRVWSVSATPDGRRAVSGSWDRTVRVWDLESGECLRTLEGHTDQVTSVSITPDGKRAVSGSLDKTLRVWDLQSGECFKTLEGHTHWVLSVSITPDGRKAISLSLDDTLRVWDIYSGECLRTPKEHTDQVTSVSVTPNGKIAISGSSDQTLRIWDMQSGECLRTLEGHTDQVISVSVTPDGKRAVSGSWDKTLRIWDIYSGECLRTLEGHTDWVRSVNVTPDGKRAISGSQDSHTRLWNIKSGRCLKIIWPAINLCLTPDGKIAIAITYIGTDLEVWNPESGEGLKILKGHIDLVRSVNLTPDGKRAVSGSDDKTLRVWDLESGQCLRTFEGHMAAVKSVSVTPDGRKAISGSWDETVRIWDMGSGECVAVYQAYGGALSVSDVYTMGHFALGTASGKVIFITARNIAMETPIVTSVRIWLHEQKSSWFFKKKRGGGRWDDSITTACLWCGQRFTVSDKILDVIRAINRNANLSPDQSPCLELPDEAWEESRLVSECPLCHKPLKFNPFIVDNRGRY